MPAGAVFDLSLRGSQVAAPVPDDARPMRLTILLHAAPTTPRRMRLRTNDILTLLASVSSVLERVPTTSVRLVAFNLDQQRELYRKDGFGLNDLPAVADSLTRLELGLVDAKVLQNRRGHVETIAGLVNGELTDAARRRCRDIPGSDEPVRRQAARRRIGANRGRAPVSALPD